MVVFDERVIDRSIGMQEPTKIMATLIYLTDKTSVFIRFLDQLNIKYEFRFGEGISEGSVIIIPGAGISDYRTRKYVKSRGIRQDGRIKS